MKIIQVFDIPEREIEYMKRIKAQILLCEPNTQIEIIDTRDPALFEKLLTAKPDVILKYPFSAYPESRAYYLLKYILGCHIVCLRTEGVLYFEPDIIKTLVGLDRYGNNIVDYEIFWSEESAKFMGAEMLRQNKINGCERVKSFGYALYEDYFRPLGKSTLADPIVAKIQRYKKENVLFFVTGFTQADYSQEDIIRAGDQVDVNNPAAFAQQLRKRLDRTETTAYNRSLWTQTITEVADRHRDALLIVKSHPTENFVNQRKDQNPYQAFQNFDNIIHITTPIPIIELMQRCGLFLHYGSTTAAESYLSKKPSILIDSHDYVLMPKGWKSTRHINIHQLPDLIAEHLRNPILYEEFPETAQILQQAFNIEAEHLSGQRLYQPSRDMAEFLLGLRHERPQPIDRADPFFHAALEYHGNHILGILQKLKSTSAGTGPRMLRCDA